MMSAPGLLTRAQVLMLGAGAYRDARQLEDGSWVALGDPRDVAGARSTLLYVDIDRSGPKAAYAFKDDEKAIEQYEALITRDTVVTGHDLVVEQGLRGPVVKPA